MLLYSLKYNFFGYSTCGLWDLSFTLGSSPGPEWKLRSPNPWTTRSIPHIIIFNGCYILLLLDCAWLVLLLVSFLGPHWSGGWRQNNSGLIGTVVSSVPYLGWCLGLTTIHRDGQIGLPCPLLLISFSLTAHHMVPRPRSHLLGPVRRSR